MAPIPKKSITLTELVILSILWSSTSFVWTNIIKQSLTFAFSKLGLGQYATQVLVALFLLAMVFAIVLLAVNIDLGRSSVFMLNDEEPGIRLPFGRKPAPETDGTFAPPMAAAAADAEPFEPESMSLLK